MNTFEIHKDEFIKLIDCVSGVIPTKSILTCIQYLYLQVKNGKIILYGTDTTNSIKIETDIDCEDEFECLLQYKVITDTLKTLSKQTIKCSYEDNKFIITAKEGTYRLRTSDDVSSYPFAIFNNDNIIQKISLDPILLKQALDSVLFCTSDDDLKPAFTGVNINIVDNIDIVATDARKLSLFTIIKDAGDYQPVSMIVPKKILDSCLKYIDKEEFIHCYHTKDKVMFNIKNITFISKLIDATYPPYNTVIPKETECKAIINKKLLTDSIKRIKSFSEKDKTWACFAFSHNLLNISYENDEKGIATENVAIDFDSEDMTMYLDFENLTEIVKRITDKEFIMEFNNPSTPCLIRNPENGDNYKSIFIIMPNNAPKDK